MYVLTGQQVYQFYTLVVVVITLQRGRFKMKTLKQHMIKKALRRAKHTKITQRAWSEWVKVDGIIRKCYTQVTAHGTVFEYYPKHYESTNDFWQQEHSSFIKVVTAI